MKSEIYIPWNNQCIYIIGYISVNVLVLKHNINKYVIKDRET